MQKKKWVFVSLILFSLLIIFFFAYKYLSQPDSGQVQKTITNNEDHEENKEDETTAIGKLIEDHNETSIIKESADNSTEADNIPPENSLQDNGKKSAAINTNNAANMINNGFSAQQGDTLVYRDGYTGLLLVTDKEFNNKRVLNGIFEPCNINLIDEWIYYTDSSYILHKIKIDGTEHTKLSDNHIYEVIVTCDYIYYIGQGMNIFRMDPDGLNITRLNKDYCRNIYLYNNKIYYINCNKNEIYGMNLDGSEQEKLSEGRQFERFIIVNDWIFATKNSNILKMKTDGSSCDIFLDEDVLCLNFDENYIYFTAYQPNTGNKNEYDLFRVNHDGKDKVKISENCSYINVLDSYIIGWNEKSYNSTDNFFCFKKDDIETMDLLAGSLNINAISYEKMNQFISEKSAEGLPNNKIIEELSGNIKMYAANPFMVHAAVSPDIDFNNEMEMIVTYKNVEEGKWRYYLSLLSLKDNKLIETARINTPEEEFIYIEIADLIKGGNMEVFIMDKYYEYPAFSLYTYNNNELKEEDTTELGLDGINQFVSINEDGFLIYHRVTDGVYSGHYYTWNGTRFEPYKEFYADNRNLN